MKSDAAAALLAMVAELDRLVRPAGLGQSRGVPESESEGWIDPFAEGQIALDALGEEMRRAATETAEHPRD